MSSSISQQDAIAAIATPLGEGGIAVIRVSGRDAIDLIEPVFTGRKLTDQPTHTAHFGRLTHRDRVIDEVVVTLFRSPRSYTGEDTVEISCHGGVLITQAVLEAVLAAGARAALPGEFTQRAFLNGKLELSQAEAVADLIHATSKKAVETAHQQLEGELGRHIKEFRQQIIDATALVELELDFSEEDVEFAGRKQLLTLLGGLNDEIHKLLETYETGRIIKNGVRTVIAGKPNAGKSTLLNTLMGKERAIVSSIAGTTRDMIDADWSYEGLLFTLTDTAGIRETEDTIEAEGVKRSHKAIREADLVLYLVDLSDRHSDAETDVISLLKKAAGDRPFLIVGTKTDLKNRQPGDQKNGGGGDSKMDTVSGQSQPIQIAPGLYTDITVSSTKGTGIDTLKRKMRDAVLESKTIDTSSLIVTSSRHRDALEKAGRHLESAISDLNQGVSGDLLSIDLRGALHQLGLITGEITTEDLLDSIFSRFCIGK
ncbi:MAG: tRNA uridine-5-carboxymethylaminomethyl(34) synthesis GTPase MnmE [Rhodothermaceae bacterium]|nr:tRNA uridine-5-carboxymethylaminomethyl(34) synthesis GTPase MnmE [Rhodothermaceae bacterium]